MADSLVLNEYSQPNQFPSKFGTLPQISARNTPEITAQNQIVPYNGAESDEKIKQLEMRINVTEKSNRALLEEVVRLQSELKGNVRRNDELLREEKNSRSQLENALRASNDVIQQLTNRLARAEEKSQEERNAISSLVNHTKSVEQAVLGSQQELLGRRDIQNQKMTDLKRELNEVSRAKESLERLSYQLVDEVRQTKNKVESQQVELQQAAQEFKNKSKRLEEENRQMLDNLRKQNESSNHTEQSSSQLKQQVETRLGELRDILVDLRNKQDTETQERRLLEQQLQMKVNDIHNGLAEQTRKREEAMHALDVVQREREHAAENERIKLQSRIAEIAEEKLDEALNILEEQVDQQRKQNDKLMAAEIKSRKQHEAFTLEKVEDLQEKLSLGITTLQQAIGGVTTQFEKEINSSNCYNNGLFLTLSQIEEIVGAAIKNLKSAIDKKLEETTALKRDAIRSGQTTTSNTEKIDELAEEQARRILKVKKELEDANTAQEAKIQELVTWQTSAKKTLKEFSKVKELPDDMYNLEQKTTKKLDDFKAKLATESEARSKDVENLRKDIARVSQLPRGAGGAGAAPIQLGPSKEDMEACQSTVRTLAESVQTVKTVLGLKIQSEQKARNKDVEALHKEVEDVRLQIEPLLRTKPVPRLFIKDKPNMDRKEAETGQPMINKWSVYTAYRWLQWKQAWHYIIWKKKTTDTLNEANSIDI
ncbi:CCDC154 [Bugula neritina]|uniref:CCDC154 n=1 Tax=Bugula neritina TaxID=10212 RepID=A0A7J7JZR3_BUGNE|nr:CCDC154 [Bugula neritina]